MLIVLSLCDNHHFLKEIAGCCAFLDSWKNNIVPHHNTTASPAPALTPMMFGHARGFRFCLALSPCATACEERGCEAESLFCVFSHSYSTFCNFLLCNIIANQACCCRAAELSRAIPAWFQTCGSLVRGSSNLHKQYRHRILRIAQTFLSSNCPQHPQSSL